MTKDPRVGVFVNKILTQNASVAAVDKDTGKVVGYMANSLFRRYKTFAMKVETRELISILISSEINSKFAAKNWLPFKCV